VVLQKTENALKAEISALLTRDNLGSQMLALDDKDVVLLLKAAIEREGSISAFARRHGLNRTILNQVVNRKRPVSSALVKTLGLRRVYAPEQDDNG
jgi:DNA-binding phage protein